MPNNSICLTDVRENNLRGITVEIPHGLLTVVTGVSGSGKSSLIFESLHAASERRYLETLSDHARRFLQRLPTPKMANASGLSPSIALGQRRSGDHARSTVGTISGMHDVLRFWFARECGLEPRDFSFVSAGACPDCRGLGSVDEVAKDLLVADPVKTLRQGALVPTTPSGYIVYSQVTVEALDTVCNAHGFNVDTPWQDLTSEQQDVVFFGSDRVRVPFGKHSLESRMRWEGITAKPRELSHYRGLIPTIEEILQRSRNENALRFARSVECQSCGGSRLNELARSVSIAGTNISSLTQWSLLDLCEWSAQFECDESVRLQRRLRTFLRLGLAHLSCDRSTASLSGGEHQRLRLGAVATGGLAGVTFVFDEPSIGLHASEEVAVLSLLSELRDAGNTVVVVEHSEQALRVADHVIDIGPGPGKQGGKVMFQGPPAQLWAQRSHESPTWNHYAPSGKYTGQSLRERRSTNDCDFVRMSGVRANNLDGIDVRFAVGRLNVVSGVAGAGKSTLVSKVLSVAVQARLEGRPLPDSLSSIENADKFSQVVTVGQAPIGRTPRSNPATYTGVFDQIRKCFAAVPLAKDRGFKPATFSFNTKNGGRCSVCEGSGREVIGMHGLPQVELECSECHGRRFRDDVLDVCFDGEHSILDVLRATVDESLEIFQDHPKILSVLRAMHLVGLGHLRLGHPATALSGGEAQRVRLAGELAKGARRKTLFVLEEPTIGLHRSDILQLLSSLDGLVEQGHTVVLVEHDLDVLRAADHLVDLGPGAGKQGGSVCGQGIAQHIATLDCPTGRALRDGVEYLQSPQKSAVGTMPMRLEGATTHNLRGLDVEIPGEGLTVVTGVSGSGKSSLVFDTLFGESKARFTEHLSGHIQRQLGSGGVRARSLHHASGLRPAIALQQRMDEGTGRDLRATVATTCELHPLLRTLWSRLGSDQLPAGAFSFFRREGACTACGGVGSVLRCDESLLVANSAVALFDGALDVRNKVVADYVDPSKRYKSVVLAVGRDRGWNFDTVLGDWANDALRELFHGCGEDQFDAVWEHDGAEGAEAHRWTTKWLGIAGDIDREYVRRKESGAVTRSKDFASLMVSRSCVVCGGDRLSDPMRSVKVAGRTLPEICRLSAVELLESLDSGWSLSDRDQVVAKDTLGELRQRLHQVVQLGLGHLHLDRATASLSSGERQRLRVARQLAAPLTGCVYVLDEPTLGLHARDTDALLQALKNLVAHGNAVVAVEHDMRVVAAADHVMEVGPGAGGEGGRLVASGPPTALPEASRAGRHLQRKGAELRSEPRYPSSAAISVRGANLHCLDNIDVTFPAGCLTAVTGVSGSGKTTLVRGVLGASSNAGVATGCRELSGLSAFDAVVDDAEARARRTRSGCVATLLGVYDEIRKQFAGTDAAREQGWRAGHFSYLGKNGGACKACGGLGWLRSDLDFLGADAWSVCEQCAGRRFDDETLAIAWLGMSIADVLDSTVDQLAQRIGGKNTDHMRSRLDAAQGHGLGYLRLGQSADSLSGGEAQRVSLAFHIASRSQGPSLLLLDEPTRGLHPDDVGQLLVTFEKLLEDGHTIIAIEHDMSLIAASDYVVDLGPEAGAGGGQLVAEGTPAELATLATSITGQALRDYVSGLPD